MAEQTPAQLPMDPFQFVHVSVTMAEVVSKLMTLPLDEMVQCLDLLEGIPVPTQVVSLGAALNADPRKSMESQGRILGELIHVREVVRQEHTQ